VQYSHHALSPVLLLYTVVITHWVLFCYCAI